MRRLCPDLYGYRWVDVDEQDGPSIDEWQQSWTAGRPVITADDECLTDNPNTPDEATDLPFAFNYYGIDRTSLNICSNGFAYFGDDHLNNNNYNRNNNIPDNTPRRRAGDCLDGYRPEQWKQQRRLGHQIAAGVCDCLARAALQR